MPVAHDSNKYQTNIIFYFRRSGHHILSHYHGLMIIIAILLHCASAKKGAGNCLCPENRLIKTEQRERCIYYTQIK